MQRKDKTTSSRRLGFESFLNEECSKSAISSGPSLPPPVGSVRKGREPGRVDGRVEVEKAVGLAWLGYPGSGAAIGQDQGFSTGVELLPHPPPWGNSAWDNRMIPG